MSEPKGAKGVMRPRPITSLMYLEDADLDLDAAASAALKAVATAVIDLGKSPPPLLTLPNTLKTQPQHSQR